jgi:hypothetical protein
MAKTASQRYREHAVWDSLELKRASLDQARFSEAALEQARKDVVEWLAEAAKSKTTRQPALYLGVLDAVRTALNSLPTDQNQFNNYYSNRANVNPQYMGGLEAALRALPLPPPRDLKHSYVELLDKEIEARTTRLDELETRVRETESSLEERLSELTRVSSDIEALRADIQTQREVIAGVSSTAADEMNEDWNETLATWRAERKVADEQREAEATEHVTALAATRNAAEVLAEHAAGDLSAADWTGRATRERRAAKAIRAAAIAAFIFAGIVGAYIVWQAIKKDFDLTVGDGILRASVVTVITAFGALLLRESGRHFREADTAEDVALSLKALAPFYAGSGESVRLHARQGVGDAVLIKNLLSRFAHRDAAKYSGPELQALVQDGANALKPPATGG